KVDVHNFADGLFVLRSTDPLLLLIICGSHITIPRKAIIPHTSSACFQPTPNPVAIGILIPDATAAHNPIEVEYTLVMMPAFVGKYFFTIAGSGTLQLAIPIPIKADPKNRMATLLVFRTKIPINNTIRLKKSVSSVPRFLAILGAVNENTANPNSGKVVIIPATPLEMPRSARISPINGPTDVIAGRKLNAINMMPKIKIKL